MAANNGGTAAYVSVLFDRMLIYNLYKLMGKIKDFWKRIKTFGHYTLNIRSFKSLSWTTITQSKCIHCQDKHGTNINIPHLSYNQQKKTHPAGPRSRQLCCFCLRKKNFSWVRYYQKHSKSNAELQAMFLDILQYRLILNIIAHW